MTCAAANGADGFAMLATTPTSTLEWMATKEYNGCQRHHRGNSEYGRVSTANGLCEIGKRFPETRQQVVELLTTQLAGHEPDVYSLNGLVVCYLGDLQAVESAEVIERAFAAGVVDESICGDWSDIRQELDVSELGLVPERPKPDRGFGPVRLFDQPSSTKDPIATASGRRTKKPRPSGSSKENLASETGKGDELASMPFPSREDREEESAGGVDGKTGESIGD